MIKSTRFLIICFISLAASVVIQSCCTEQWQLTGGGDLQIEGNQGADDQINEAFILTNLYEADLVYEGFNEFSPIQTAWATTCEYSYKDDIDMSSVKLSLNRAFTLNNETILAGSNLLDLPQFTSTLESYVSMMYIDIEEQFFTDATFEKGEHQFFLEAVTEDGLELKSDLTLDFDF